MINRISSPWALTQNSAVDTKKTDTLSFQSMSNIFYLVDVTFFNVHKSITNLRTTYKQRTKIFYTLQNLPNVTKITSLYTTTTKKRTKLKKIWPNFPIHVYNTFLHK